MEDYDDIPLSLQRADGSFVPYNKSTSNGGLMKFRIEPYRNQMISNLEDESTWFQDVNSKYYFIWNLTGEGLREYLQTHEIAYCESVQWENVLRWRTVQLHCHQRLIEC